MPHSSFIFDVNETDFLEKVLKASDKQPVLVDFWADWCPPCRFLTPVLEKVTQDYRGEVLLAKVEVDENMRLAGRYKLRGFPTVILFIRGEEAGRFSGARSEPQVRTFISGLAPAIVSREAGT
jgi:thioredoxin 1